MKQTITPIIPDEPRQIRKLTTEYPEGYAYTGPVKIATCPHHYPDKLVTTKSRFTAMLFHVEKFSVFKSF